MIEHIRSTFRRRIVRLCVLSLLVLTFCSFVWPAQTALAATFTVTSTADSGAGTLRQAILDANTNAGPDTILFNLGGGVQTIQPTSALPTITGQVEINALAGACSTWPPQPTVALDGSLAGFNADGFQISATGSRIIGLYIYDFDSDGVEINAADAIVGCNIIGLNPAGNVAGNSQYGVNINGNNNIIGNNGAIIGNVISGNIQYGVAIENSVSGNIIRGNYIGTDATGTLDRGNFAGVAIVSASNTTIGGTSSFDRNVISGNDDQGVWFFFAESGNKVIGNYIGLNAAGNAALPNATEGVKIQDTNGVVVGGTASGEGNRIAFNTQNGVLVTSGSQNNRLLGNQIFSNVQLGIDLGGNFGGDGVTFNDSGDGDSGANARQNFPVILEASQVNANTIKVRGSLNSTANSSFRIEIFASATCDANGSGEGETFLGSAPLTTNFSGNGTFDVQLAQTVAIGQKITVNATNNGGNAPGNTSEFSVCQSLVAQAPPSNAPQMLPDIATTNEDTAVTINVLVNDSSPNANPLVLASAGVPNFGTTQIVNDQVLYTPPANFSGEATFSYSAHNGDTSNTRQSTVVVTVNSVNDLPTDILNNITLNENTTTPSLVGQLTMVDVEGNSTGFFTLVDTGVPTDNANFSIFGRAVLLFTPLDFRDRTNITLGVRVRDLNGGILFKTLVIPLPVINHIPDGAALSNDRINENQPAGFTVGTLTGIDVDTNDTHTFALAEGGGDIDNFRFRIEGSTLKTNAVLDFETKAVYNIRVQITDNGGEFRFDNLSITVNNLPSPPDAPENNLAFCQGGSIPLITRDSTTASRRVSVIIESVVISNLTSNGCTVNGKLKVITNGNTVSNLPFSGKVNERNQFSSAIIPDFMLAIAGIPLRAGGVEITYVNERPVLHITDPALVMPKEFGGLTAEISVPTQIDTNGIRFGTGTINLPSISTASGFELSLSGKLEPSGEGFKISADGTIGIPNIGKKQTGAAQTCEISAGVTIFADANGRTVMVIAAGKDYPGQTSTTFVSMIELAADPNGVAPNVVNGPQATDTLRLDAVRAGASCSPGLAIGTTGLFLTGLSGEITVTPGDERVDVAVTIESGKSLPLIGPMLAIDGEMGLQPVPFKLDLGAAIRVLSIEVGRADASITPRSFKASMSFRQIGYFGSASVAAFVKDGRPTFTGSAKVTIGVEKHAVFFLIPPFDINLASAGAEVGEFTNGNFGLKGTVDILGLVSTGFFVDHRGTVALGDVDRFQLISGPSVAAARAAYLQAMAAGATVDAAIAEQFAFLDDGNGGNGGVIIRTPLVKPTVQSGEIGGASVTDVITQINLLQHGDVIFGLASQGPLDLTLFTPGGIEVTPANYTDSGTLGYAIAYTTSLTYQVPDALERFAENNTPVAVDESLAKLLFTPLDADVDVNNVDLVIDGTTVYFDLTFQNAVGWLKPIALSAGNHSVALVKHGTNETVLSTTVNLAEGSENSLVNVGGASAGFATVLDNYDAPATLGKAKVRFYNGASATLKMVVNGTPLFTDIGYKAGSDYVLVDAGSATIEFRDNGTDALVSQTLAVDLADGGVYTFFSTDYSADGFDIAIVQRQDALYKPTYLTYYSVDQAQMNEEWEMKLVGDTDNIPFEIAILGPSSPSILANVLVDANNLAATEVSWQLTSDTQPVTVTVFANPGEVTVSLVVSNTDDTTSTQEIALFEGFPIAEFMITDPGELGGQLVTKQVNLTEMESGNYHLWIRVEDGINAPVSAYAASALTKSDIGTQGVQSIYGINTVWVAKSGYNALTQLADAADIAIDRESDFPTTWTAAITTEFEPQTNSLYVEWDALSHPDADSYRLLFGHTPLSPTQTIEVGGSIAEFDETNSAAGPNVGFFTLRDMMPGVPYYISIEAVDTESGKRVRSQEVVFTAVAGGFTLTSTQQTVNMEGGDIATVPVTLNADETLFFPNVWLSTNLGDAAPGITASFVADNDDDANLNTTAPTRNLQISVDATVPDGRYPLVITGYNGNAKQALTLEIVVGEPITGVYMPMITR